MSYIILRRKNSTIPTDSIAFGESVGEVKMQSGTKLQEV